jgi:hypothetical protein
VGVGIDKVSHIEQGSLVLIPVWDLRKRRGPFRGP